MVGQRDQGKVGGKSAEGEIREHFARIVAHMYSSRTGEMSWGERRGGKSETETREGRKRDLFLEGERAAILPLLLSLSCKNWGKELDGQGGGPQGGAHGVSSGQAFHPAVPQFSPSC